MTKTASSNPITHITSAQAFDDLLTQATKPIIVKFSTEWCGACKTVEPLFITLAQELSNDYIFVAIDASKVASLSKYYGIHHVPTTLFIKNGKEIAPQHRLDGAFERDQFIQFLELNKQAQ